MPNPDPLPLAAIPSIVAISDFQDGWPLEPEPYPDPQEAAAAWREGGLGPAPGPEGDVGEERARLEVLGGYLERLPLACIKRGLADHAEIWHHWRPAGPAPFRREGPLLARRAFHMSGPEAPIRSSSMLGFVEAFGAPHILCAWGLGVDASLLRACARSFRIYNSIDAPALRVPEEASALFDLILVGSPAQREAVLERHPQARTAIMPIGPQFADPVTFRPLGGEKPYDVVYVAAAQPYKRHDVLFDALARMPETRLGRPARALLVVGYGELAGEFRHIAEARGLDLTIVGPPGVPHAEVNRLVNQARVGVVCGIQDGCPAILTEYMLAGLPVLANAQLCCGLDYILPATGRAAEPERFHEALADLILEADRYAPRPQVLARWTWPHTVERLAAIVGEARRAWRLSGSY